MTYGDLAAAIPFGNTVDSGELQGKYLKALFKSTTYSSYYHGKAFVDVKLLQDSGLTIVYDLSQPEGSRVVSIKIHCRKCELPVYVNLDEEKYYRFVVNSFLAVGGDGLSGLSDNLRNHRVGSVDIDAAAEYVEKYPLIYTEIAGRITFVDTNLKKGGKKGTAK